MKGVVVFNFYGEYELLDSFPIGNANTGQYIYQALNQAWYMNFRKSLGKTNNLISFPTPINAGDVPIEYRKIIKTLELLDIN